MRLIGLALISLLVMTSIAFSSDDLLAAIENDDIGAVKVALANNPILEPDCPPFTNCKPLGYAVGWGNIEIVKLLIDAGADPDGIGAYNDVPLIKAMNASGPGGRSAEEITAMQIYLMENGADPNIPNAFGMTPFFGFCLLEEFEKMDVALKYGADVNTTRPLGPEPDAPRSSILMQAAQGGLKEIVIWLIAQGADVNFKNSIGETALSLARAGGHSEIEEILLEVRAA